MNIRSITRFAYVLAIVTLIAGFSACDNTLNEFVSMLSDDQMPQMMGGEIPIGVVVSLTGKDAEPYGLPMQRGFEMARDEINAAQLTDARAHIRHGG